jgi:hypothetical protein
VKYLKKPLRIAVWTLCIGFFMVFCFLLIQKPRGLAGTLEMVLSIDPFLGILWLFIGVVAAFMVDLWYLARYQ